MDLARNPVQPNQVKIRTPEANVHLAKKTRQPGTRSEDLVLPTKIRIPPNPNPCPNRCYPLTKLLYRLASGLYRDFRTLNRNLVSQNKNTVLLDLAVLSEERRLRA